MLCRQKLAESAKSPGYNSAYMLCQQKFHDTTNFYTTKSLCSVSCHREAAVSCKARQLSHCQRRRAAADGTQQLSSVLNLLNYLLTLLTYLLT